MKKINLSENKIKEIEDKGWIILAEKSLKKLWNNKKDDKVWNKYL